MRLERTDLAVGLLVLVSVALLGYAVTWIIGRGGGGSGYPLEVVFDQAAGVVPQGAVELQGYRVGSVQAVYAERGEGGAMRFRARLSLEPELSGGVPLRLPVGTRAELIYRGLPIGAGIVALMLPEHPGEPLPPGATIPGAHAPTAVDLIHTATEQLTGELQLTLGASRTMMDSLTRTATSTGSMIHGLRAELVPVLGGLQRELVAAEALTREAHNQLATVAPAAAAGMDSATALIGGLTRVVARVDLMLADNQPKLASIVANLDTTTLLVEHLTRQVSLRPMRVLFSGAGALPPPTPPDTIVTPAAP